MTCRGYSTNPEETVKVDRLELRALRAAIIKQIDADMARIDRMISALNLMDGPVFQVLASVDRAADRLSQGDLA